MDLELDAGQELLDDSLRSLFSAHAGTRRAQAVGAAVDAELLGRLHTSGYLDVFDAAGPVEAVLVAERAAQAAARAPVVARVLVGPLAGAKDLPPTVGLVSSPRAPVKWAGTCDAYLVLDGEAWVLAGADDVDIEPIRARSGTPAGFVRVRHAEAIGAAGELRRAWEVGIAAEVGATALAAIELTAAHVTQRHQFGRPIGSFQAVQHRLARSYANAQATRWLARRAAWHHGDDFLTASAAAFACLTAREAYDDTHQVTGAIGITDEYGLTTYTMRLLELHAELGGRGAHARRVARARATTAHT